MRNIRWKFKTVTSCHLGWSSKDSEHNMLQLNEYYESLETVLLNTWSRKTRLTGDNRITIARDNGGRVRVDAEQTWSCGVVPDVAVISLDFRTRHEPITSSGNRSRNPNPFLVKKDCRSFSIPTEVNFRNSQGIPTHELHAVVVHEGTAKTGHYWTYQCFVERDHMAQCIDDS